MRLHLTPTQLTLISLYVPSALLSFSHGMLVPVLPALTQAFAITPGEAAQIVTAQSVGSLLALFPSGIVVDRYGRKPALIAGPLLMTAGSLLAALSPVYWVLLLGTFILGVGSSAWQMSREVTAIDLVTQQQRGRMLSVFFGISSIGVAIGPLLGAAILEEHSFRMIFWIYVALSLFTFAASSRLGETGTQVTTASRGSMFDIGGLKEIDPELRATYLIVVFGTFTAMMRMTLRQSILPLLAVTQLGFDNVQVGWLFAMIGVVEFVMIAPTGILSDRYGRKAATVPSAVLALIAFTLYAFGTTFIELAAISILGAIASGLALGSMTTYTYDVVPAHARGRLQTLRRSIAAFGGISGPAVGGYIVDSYKPSTAFLCFAPLQLAAAFLLIFVAKETMHRNTPASTTATTSTTTTA